MENKSVNQEIVELCDDFILFFQQLKEEVKSIPNEDSVELVCKWHSYFEEHGNVVGKFSYIKNKMEEIEQDFEI